MSRRCFGIHLAATRGDDLARSQVERPIEVRLLATGRSVDHGGSATRSPDAPQGRLQIQTGLVFGQNHRFRGILGDVKELFFPDVAQNRARLLRGVTCRPWPDADN